MFFKNRLEVSSEHRKLCLGPRSFFSGLTCTSACVTVSLECRDRTITGSRVSFLVIKLAYGAVSAYAASGDRILAGYHFRASGMAGPIGGPTTSVPVALVSRLGAGNRTNNK